MNIRWRLGTLGIQLVALALATWAAEGKVVTDEAWFFAGLLAIAINPQLWEPFYPRPADVIGNAIFGLLLIATTTRNVAPTGWTILTVLLTVFLVLGALATVLGAAREPNRFAGLATSARQLTQLASAKVIYSGVFLLSALEAYPGFTEGFWVLICAWLALLGLGGANWQTFWSNLRGGPVLTQALGMTGPAWLTVTAPSLPSPGTWVALEMRGVRVEGVVLSRIRRREDVWAQIHVGGQAECERLLQAGSFLVRLLDGQRAAMLGSVCDGSTDRSLAFQATQDLEVGQVVCTPRALGNPEQVLYQVSTAVVAEVTVKDGSQLVARTLANQLGVFDAAEQRIRRHRWIPPPGAPVSSFMAGLSGMGQVPPSWLQLGTLIGTDLPVHMDLASVSEGHLAILGMTRMGKTSLAVRIALALGCTKRVVILDVTGEYRVKRGLPAFDVKTHWKQPGVSVHELPLGKIGPDFAVRFLEDVANTAAVEYQNGTPIPRVILIDEAHQFVPEPAVIGFQAAGRDSAYKFGVLMMQVRKYGISIILVSQRTAVVAKSALSQCENLIAFRNVDQTGLDYLEDIAGVSVRNLIPQLKQGEALALGPAVSSDNPVAIRIAQR